MKSKQRVDAFFQSNPRSSRRGYVLLVVLAVGILLTTVLAALAKTSLRRALAAVDTQRRLQQRWGSETLQQAILRRAPKVFEERDEELAKIDPNFVPPTALRDVLTLGGVTYDLVLGDEDAKLNLNAIYRSGGTKATESALKAFLGRDIVDVLRLSPAVDEQSLARARQTGSFAAGTFSGTENPDEPAAAMEQINAFRSWGEVFDLSALSVVFGNDAALPNVTTQITCWGGGQINFRRASKESFAAIVSSVVSPSEAQGILNRYQENPSASIQILAQTQIGQEPQRERLLRMVSSASLNYSLWIDASTVGRRPMRRFTVMQLDDSGVTQYQQFAH